MNIPTSNKPGNYRVMGNDGEWAIAYWNGKAWEVPGVAGSYTSKQLCIEDVHDTPIECRPFHANEERQNERFKIKE